jgi:hypothetical protein
MPSSFSSTGTSILAVTGNSVRRASWSCRSASNHGVVVVDLLGFPAHAVEADAGLEGGGHGTRRRRRSVRRARRRPGLEGKRLRPTIGSAVVGWSLVEIDARAECFYKRFRL